jgi:hypothetical protein
MQLRKLAMVLGICALSTPVWAQVSSSASGSASTTIGATGVNETAGQSSAGVKAQGSGSADVNANRPGMPDRATGMDRADQRRADRSREHKRSHARSGSRRDRTADTIPTRPYPGTRDANGSLLGGIGATTGAGVGVGGVGANVGAGASAGGSTHGNPGDATGTK